MSDLWADYNFWLCPTCHEEMFEVSASSTERHAVCPNGHAWTKRAYPQPTWKDYAASKVTS